MTRLVIDRHENLLCAAIAAGLVTDLYAADAAMPDNTGAVVTATVTRRMAGQGAAIVKWQGHEGYWQEPAAKNTQPGNAARLQIKTAAHAGKLARLSADIALPGRFLLHLPQAGSIKLSARAKGLIPPACLKSLPGGWIVRHTAAQANEAQLLHEAGALVRLAAAPAIPAPAVWQRAIAEHGASLKEILVPDAATERAVKAWLDDMAPDLLPAVALARNALDWDSLLAGAAAPTVPLPNGGALTIEPTRALCAVDVDTGPADNCLQTNLQAAQALARQLRLRNCGGIIVVDFISMPKPADRAKLLMTLRQATADDPAGVEIFGISKLGLVEMTRTRRGKTLPELLAPQTPQQPRQPG